MPGTDAVIRSSPEDAIELIKDHRDELIIKLTHIEFLRSYLATEFHLENPSSVKLEFVKRSLLELKSSPVDLSHYGPLVLETRRKGSLSVSKNNEHYFRKDIERAIQNYL